MAGFWENDALADALAPKGKGFWENDALADAAPPVSLPVSPGGSEADRAMAALAPFFDKGVSTRNSAGQWTGEARALLTKQGVNPDAIDQRAERGILSAYEAKQQGPGDGAAAVGRGLINGVPVIGPALLSGANKAAAFVRSVQRGTSYSDELKNVEAFGEATAKENPGATTGGELAGGVLGTAPLVAVAPAAFGAGAGSLAARSAASLGSGAVLGGADAAARSGGDLYETGKGAGIGGAFGGVAPGAGALVGKGVRAAADALAARRVSVPGASNPAAAMLAEDLKNSGGAAPVRARLEELGPEAMLLDASPSFQGLAQGLAVEPNTRQAMVAPLRNRNLATNARLSDDLTAALGTAENPVALTETLTDARRAVAEPAFRRYEGAPLARNTALDKLAERPIIADALRQAEKVAGNQGKPLARVTMDEAGRVVPDNAAEAFAAGSRGRIDQGLGNLLGRKGALATADEIIAKRAEEAGPLYEAARAAVIPDEAIPVDLLRRLKKAGALSQAQQKMAIDGQPFDIGRMTSWDYMKRALDDRIGAAKRKGSNDDARIFTSLKNELTSSIDEAIPEYAQARQAFAGHSELVDALEEGSRVFSPSTTREAVAQAYKALTPGEQEMYRLGAGNALREKLANTRDGNGLPHAVFGNQALREKLAVIAPDGDAAKAFGNLIAGEQRAFTEATVPDARAWRNAYEIVAARAAKLGDTAEGRAASQAAADLRARLEANADFKTATAKTDEYDRLIGAVDKGTKVLAGDRGTIHPRELETYLSGASPSEQAALRAGTRGELDRIVGTQANDLVALRRQVLSDGDWNRAKLAQIFGEDEANRVFQSVDRESAFRDAYNKIVENSQTAQRSQSAERVAVRGTAPKQGDAGLAIAGGVGGTGGVAAALGMKGAKFGLNARGRASDLARNRETAAILTMKAGPERDALIAALEDRLAAVGRGEAPANQMDRFVRQMLQSLNDRSERPEARAAISAR